MVEKILAGLGLAVCAALLAGMLLGERRRERLRITLLGLARWPQARARARREAAEAIQRAHARSRHEVERDGNVYRPHTFNGRRRDGDADEDGRTLH